MSAYTLTKQQMITLPSGHDQAAYPGEVVICRNGQPIEIATDAVFRRRYEVIEPGLALPKNTVEWLEAKLGLGSTTNPAALCAAVQRLADISIGTIAITFTPSQLEEIKARAEKRGLSVEAELQRVVERLAGDAFWTV